MSTKKNSLNSTKKRSCDTNTKKRNFSNRRGSYKEKEPSIQVPEGTKYSARKHDYDAIHSNDISWYNKDRNQYDPATNIPARTVLGIAEPFPAQVVSVNGDTYDSIIHDYVPTVMNIYFVPGVGVGTSYTSAINKCFQKIYSTIYARTSGASLSFPQWELGVFTMAVQSIAMNIAICKKALSANFYRPTGNLSVPQTLLSAMGVDHQDLSDNYNLYVSKLNEVIQDFNTIKVPAFIDVFKRHYALAHNVYIDENNAYSQFYNFIPECYYLFSDIGISTDGTQYNGIAGAYAIPMPYHGTSAKPLSAILSVIDKQIDAIRSSSDAANILGGLYRTFPDSALMDLSPFEPYTVLEPVYDKIILEQIMNCTIVGPRHTINDRYLANDPNPVTIFGGVEIVANPETNVIYSTYGMTRISDFHYLSCGGDSKLVNFFDVYEGDEWRTHIMEATRLIPIVAPYDTGGDIDTQHLIVESAGTEVITRVSVVKPTTTDGPSVPVFYEFYGAIGPLNYEEDIMKLTYLLKFNYHPRIYLYWSATTDAGTFESTNGMYFGDINYYTIINNTDLDQLHRVALLSLFSVGESDMEAKPIR